MTDLELFRVVATEYSATGDSVVSTWLGIAAGMISADYFGANYQLAKVYLSAHLLKTSELDSSSGGAITSKRAGDMAESYGVDQSAGQYSTTGYGRLYWTLLRSRPGRAPGLISI